MILLDRPTAQALEANYKLGILHFISMNPGSTVDVIAEGLGLSPLIGGMILSGLAKQGKTFQVDGHHSIVGKNN